MRVGNKEHLADLVKLLVANDADFATSGRWLDNEAELSVVSCAR